MANITDLIKTIRPAKDKYFAFHPASLLMTFSTMNLYGFLATPLCLNGNSRYFPMSCVSQMPNLSQTSSFKLSLTFGERYIRDFSKLIFWPDSAQNFLSTSNIASQVAGSTFPNNMISSAKKRWEKPKFSLKVLQGGPNSIYTLLLNKVAQILHA